MGYPFDKRYIDQIRESERACDEVKLAYRTLRNKWLGEHTEYDDICIPLKDEFALLGEAFDLVSLAGDVTDQYHFMWDVIDELLTPNRKEKNGEN